MLFARLRKILPAIFLSWLVITVIVPANYMLNIPLAKAATFTVINTNDSGAGSFRQAVTDANANPGMDTINFHPDISGGTITLIGASEISASDPVIIDGTTLTDVQLGPDITITGDDDPSSNLTFLSGSEGSIVKGLSFDGGYRCLTVFNNGLTVGGTGSRDGNTFDDCATGFSIEYSTNVYIYNNIFGGTTSNSSGINSLGSSYVYIGGSEANQRNIIINNAVFGIVIGNTTDTTIKGNYIGTETGSDDQGNQVGIWLGNGVTTDITIGGTTSAERNVISGNTSGIQVVSDDASGTVIQGNYIGVSAPGTSALGNSGIGITVTSPCADGDCKIGGSAVGQRNVISGNGSYGINVQNSSGWQILNNYIGVNAAGDSAIPNAEYGIKVGGTSTNIIIGESGASPSTHNVISGNTGQGIEVTASGTVRINGNYVGLGADGLTDLGNSQNGIKIAGGATGVIIGHSSATSPTNWISGNNNAGITIEASITSPIYSSAVGTNAAGTGAVGNTQAGILAVASGSTIGGGSLTNGYNVISGNGSYGVQVWTGVANTTISGNLIGTSLAGTSAIPNTEYGIIFNEVSPGNVVGNASATGLTNIISGNTKAGIDVFSSTGVSIYSSGIGVNLAGTGAIANGENGIVVGGTTTGLTIGGTLATSRNVISGNINDGINISSGSTFTIRNNYIGTDVNGTAAIANTRNGIYANGLTNSTIGGSGVGNVISGNTENGIDIIGTCTGTTISGNYIGLASDGMAALGNTQKGIGSSATGLTIGSTTAKNYISSNNRGIWLFDTDTVVINNVIGCAVDETTRRPNVGNGIDVPAGDDQVIGGANVNEGNLICITSGDRGIAFGDATGKYVSIRGNSFLPPLVGLYDTIWFAAGANESMAAPTVTYADTSYAYGTTCNNCTVDFVGGTNFETTTANASGNWAMHADLSTEGSGYTTPYFIAMNASGSSSHDTAQTPTTDSTAPTDIVVTSTTGHSTSTAAYTFTGTKETYSSVERDGSGWVAIGSATAWTYPITLAEGANIFNICSLDYSSNRSGTGSYTITLDTVVPSVPVLSYSASVTTSTASIIVTGEVGTSIYVNNVDSGTDIGGSGSETISVSVTLGVSNTYIIKLIDAASNQSPTATATITEVVEPIIYGGGSSGSNATDSGEETPEEIDSNGLAGEEEVDVEEIVEPAEEEPVTEPVEEEPTTEPTTEPAETAPETTPTILPVIKEEEIQEEIIETPIIEETNIDISNEVEEIAEESNIDMDVKKILEEVFSDSDSDGITDAWEKIYFGGNDVFDWAADTDNDGVNDGDEYDYGSNPLKDDGDNDGISDYEELFIYQTNSNNWDSDGDGLSDTAEITYGGENAAITKNKKEVDQTIYDGDTDTDNDGMSDYIEVYYGTDLEKADSDGDGLSDTEELFDYNLDPNKVDYIASIADLPVEITNLTGDEIFGSSNILFKGVAASESRVLITIINEDNHVVAFLEDRTEGKGKFATRLEKEIGNGEYKMFVSEMNNDDDITDLSTMTTFYIDDTQDVPEIETVNGMFDLKATPGTMVFATWKSMIFSAVLLADMETGELVVQAPDNLEEGSHSLYVYAFDEETNLTGDTLMVNFSIDEMGIANIAAVQPGTTKTSTSYVWFIVLGFLAIGGIGIFVRNERKQHKEEEKLIKKL